MHSFHRGLRLVWLLTSVLLAVYRDVGAQTLFTAVDALVRSVSLDSLTSYVSDLSGETPIWVSDSVLIVEQVADGSIDSAWVAHAFVKLPNRVEWANDAATHYLERKLRAFGYDSVVVDSYPDDELYPATKNVLAFKAGTDPSGPVWLIGGHYDSVLQAPGADDNASGTAVVLEAARLMAKTETSASIIFGLWDTEEAGLIGSDLFASRASQEALRIDGVLNFDMVGWDGDQDRSPEVHANESALWIGEYVTTLVADYGLDLRPFLAVGEYGRSDHVSFRKWGYPAILVIEELGVDFNPYYHSPEDRMERFSFGFFHEVAKLAVGVLAQLSLSGTLVSVEEEVALSAPETFKVFPNPADHVLNIDYGVFHSHDVRLIVTDLLGRVVVTREVGWESRTIRWSIPNGLPNGVYFVTLTSDQTAATRPVVIAR